MNHQPNPPALPLNETQRRYEALAPIEDLPGERTFLTRCATFDQFLQNGAMCAAGIRWFDRDGQGEEHRAMHPQLAELLVECWPNDPSDFNE